MAERVDLAYLYPGQGSQKVGMGLQIYNVSPSMRELFNTASEELGYSLDEVCFVDPHNKLTGPMADTSVVQPALFTVEVGTRRHMVNELGLPNGQIHMGHSAGKLAALEGSGSLDFIQGLKVMKERGSIMQDAKAALGAAVGIVIGGPTKEAAEEILHGLKDVTSEVKITVHNTPIQYLLGGPRDQVTRALTALEAKRKFIYEDASLSHHPALQPAQDKLNHFLDTLQTQLQSDNLTLLGKPIQPVIDDIQQRVIETAAQAEASLRTHLVDPLLWHASLQLLKEKGVRIIAEIGPGSVLRGFFRSDFKGIIDAYGTETPTEIQAFAAAIK